VSARKRPHGHPARKSRHQKRGEVRERYTQPDATEKTVQEANAAMRRNIHESSPEEGLVAGPLMVAAEHLAVQIQEEFDLDGEEHRAMITHYLRGAWGEVAHAFPENVDIPGYYDWRKKSRRRVLKRALPWYRRIFMRSRAIA
jgi:hypothetical protein